MPAEWTLCIMAPILKGNGDIRNCSGDGAVKLHEHGMKVKERVLGKMFHRIVCVDEIQFGFMHKREQLVLCLS